MPSQPRSVQAAAMPAVATYPSAAGNSVNPAAGRMVEHRHQGQHFFFDAGNGAIPGIGDITSAVSTMNHLAFHVPADRFDAYRRRLKEKGVRVGPGAQP